MRLIIYVRIVDSGKLGCCFYINVPTDNRRAVKLIGLGDQLPEVLSSPTSPVTPITPITPHNKAKLGDQLPLQSESDSEFT